MLCATENPDSQLLFLTRGFKTSCLHVVLEFRAVFFTSTANLASYLFFSTIIVQPLVVLHTSPRPNIDSSVRCVVSWKPIIGRPLHYVTLPHFRSHRTAFQHLSLHQLHLLQYRAGHPLVPVEHFSMVESLRTHLSLGLAKPSKFNILRLAYYHLSHVSAKKCLY